MNIGNFNTKVGTIFNQVSAASSVIKSVESIFGLGSGTVDNANLSAIGRLKSYVSKNDVLSNNLFYVRFGVPSWAAGTQSGRQVTTDLSLLCFSASLPGVAFATSEHRRYGMGVTEKMPTFPIFTDLSLTFIGDGQGTVRNFFNAWMNNVIYYDDHGTPSTLNSTQPYEVGYKSDYSVPIEIVVVDRYNREIFVTRIHQAFPVALGDQSLNWNDNDSLMTVPVTFTYQNWSTEIIKIPNNDFSSNLGLIGSLVKIGTAVQTLASIKKPHSIGDIVNVTRNASSSINGLKGLIF